MHKLDLNMVADRSGFDMSGINAQIEFYQRILENIPTDIAIFDASHRYLYVNPCAIRNKELRQYIIGKDDFEYIAYRKGDMSLAEKRRERFNEMMRTGEVVSWEDTTIDPDGQPNTSLRKLYPVRDNNKNIILVIGFGIDITERKKNEDFIQNINIELEKKVQERTQDLKMLNDELTAFNAIVAHDLQTPIRSLSGFSTILMREYSEQMDQRGHEMLEIINRNAKYMAALVSGLLRFAQIGTTSLLISDIDMKGMVKAIIDEAIVNANGAKIRWEIKELPSAICDNVLVAQVWQNLIHNAIKYSSKKSNPAIEIGAIKKNGRLIYFVKDNGVGFDTRYKDRLFKIFQRLHNTDEYEGTGVGLSLVKKIIMKHNGDIWAESSPGIGSTFFFTLSGIGE